jgi:two-component system chemotaxis response regulator CheY
MTANVDIDTFDILIVDDNVQILAMLRSMCRAAGIFGVRGCSRVDEAWGLMHTRVPDVVLTDWEMEPETGLSFLSAIRASVDQRIARLPVIVITAYADQERVVAAKDAGANFFLKKPVSIRALRERIVAAMSGAATGRALIAASLDAQRRMREATAALEELRARYVEDLPEQIAAIRTLFAAIEASVPTRAIDVRRLFGLLHDVKGQGTMFGYPLLTALAQPLCEMTRGRTALIAAECDAIRLHLDAMELVVRHRIETESLGERMMAELAALNVRARTARGGDNSEVV